MSPSSVSLETGEASPSVDEGNSPQAQPLVRLSEQSLSEMSYEQLQQFEDEAFHRIPGSCGDEREELIHCVAQAIVAKGKRSH